MKFGGIKRKLAYISEKDHLEIWVYLSLKKTECAPNNFIVGGRRNF